MKKIIIFFVSIMLFSISFLSGCNEQQGTTNLPNSDQTNTQLNEESPDPYFPSKNSHEGYTYAPDGTATSVIIGKEVKNRGKPGEVFVSVTCAQRGWNASKVFYMDANENVTMTAHINARIPPHEIITWNWVARAALPDDISHGEVYIERLN